MTRTPTKALAAAVDATTGYGGRCLQFVRTCFDIPSRYASAIAAWNSAENRHPTSSTSSIPIGAPVFFAPHGSPYGHVAIYAGDGLMRSTNSATGRIHTHRVADWVRWGYRLLGWTEDLNGVRIPGLSLEAGWYHTATPTAGQKVTHGYRGPDTRSGVRHRRAMGFDLRARRRRRRRPLGRHRLRHPLQDVQAQEGQGLMTTTVERTALSDRAVSYLRTVVPVLWGTVGATILRVVSPHLPGDVGQALADLLESELALSLVTAASIAGWSWVWRRLERRIPDWLVRLVLGSARTPGYTLPAAVVQLDDGGTVSGVLPTSATLTGDERENLASLAAALDEGDPGRSALERILE